MTLLKAGILAFAFACILRADFARAAVTDDEAHRRIDDAINTQYASANVDAAEQTLLEIVSDCTGSCSDRVIARAWMYVGVVRGGGRSDAAGAAAAFSQAKGIDPGVQLDDLFATDSVREIFVSAQPPPPSLELPRSNPSLPTLRCSLEATEVETQRPVPLSCQGGETVAKLELAYRHELRSRWRRVPLTQQANAWLAEIPCADTKRIGIMAYHVQAYDAAGAIVGVLGSEEAPMEFGLVERTNQAPPSLPGKPAPRSCRPVKLVRESPKLSTYGDTCSDTSQCSGGLTCTGGKCITHVTCDSDAECFSGICSNGTCEVPDESACQEGEDCAPANRSSNNWFGIQGGVDFAIISGEQVCGRDADVVAFSCFENGLPYQGLPNENFAGGIEGGFRAATTRVMLSYERALGDVFSLEARVGFAFNGGPESPSESGGDGSSFLPLHAEGRAKLYFTGVYAEDGHGLSGPSGFVTLGGGLAQIDPKLTVQVAECRESPFDPAGVTQTELNCSQSQNRALENKNVDVYQRLGQGFATLGLGLRWGFGRHVAAVATVNARLLLPSSGFALSPVLGLLAGF